MSETAKIVAVDLNGSRYVADIPVQPGDEISIDFGYSTSGFDRMPRVIVKREAVYRLTQVS